MKLKEKIDVEIKQSMIAKNADRLRVLRSIKSLIMISETEKGKSGELTTEREMDVLKKAAKQRRDSADVFQANGRQELADVELKELSVIEEFLPRQMTEQEVTKGIKAILTDLTNSNADLVVDMKQIGSVMKEFNNRFPGQDGKLVSQIIRNFLV